MTHLINLLPQLLRFDALTSSVAEQSGTAKQSSTAVAVYVEFLDRRSALPSRKFLKINVIVRFVAKGT